MKTADHLGRVPLALGIAGGAAYMVLAWMMVAVIYLLFALVSFVLARGFHVLALRFLPAPEADFLWWFAVVVLLISTTYGGRMGIEYVSERGESEIARERLARASRGNPGPVAVEMPKTRPSTDEIERRGGGR